MLKIYGVPISVHTRKVIAVAIAKDLPHEVVPVVPVIPGNPPPDWLQISPTGRIPALADGDFIVADSAAICAYLERIRPASPVYPKGDREFATVLSLEQYAGSLFSNVVHPLFHEVFVHPKIDQAPTNQAKVDEVLAIAVPRMFGHLDGVAPHDGFLAGERLSVADIAIASNLITYQYIGFDLYRSRFPRLAAWFDRIVAQPAMIETLRREETVVDAMGLKRDFLAAVPA